MLAGAGRRVCRGIPLFALIAAAGCATTGGATDDQRERNEIVIEVRNDNFNQAVIYHPNSALRIGIVGGKSKATFKVDWRHEEVELQIRLLTGGSALLRPQTGGPEQTWTFVIPATCC